MTIYRIVVTGSRDWDDKFAVHRGIDAAIDDCRRMAVFASETLISRDIVIAQGGSGRCDGFAFSYAERQGYASETFCAHWAMPARKHDPAGPIRNGKMLRENQQGSPCLARVVVGFPLGDRSTSPGTWNCLMQASALGIPLRVFGRTAPPDKVQRRRSQGVADA